MKGRSSCPLVMRAAGVKNWLLWLKLQIKVFWFGSGSRGAAYGVLDGQIWHCHRPGHLFLYNM